MRKNIALHAALFSVLLCLAALAGCAKNDGLCTVEGTVTLDGAPLAEGTINFGPMAGSSGTATGAKIENGKYSARASEGEMIVNIRSQKKETTQDPEHGETMTFTELIPEKYNQQSELKATIKPGKNTFDFDLKSEAKE
ncbi:MAG: hypothetical protein IJM30_08310 [Thermoguttaceae bacterium]|nr:hypothetical protein [Thermoguttaceae bacterium]